MSLRHRVFRIALPITIVLLGLAVMVVFLAKRKEPEKEIAEDLGALVHIFPVHRQDWQVTVSGTGTVQAAQEISVIPQVSGEVLYVSPSLVAGGFFQTDEVLLKIDDTDYKLALEQAKAAEAKAELNLATMESWARVARAEWERIRQDDEDSPNPLVVYEPQLKNAQAELASAQSAIRQAELNLARTEIRAPFNCRVRSENIDLGQYVRAGSSIAVIAGTDSAEVIVPLPFEELQWLSIPSTASQQKGSFASVHMDIKGTVHTWKGTIVRSTGEVDAKSRMAKIVIEVHDPYGITENGPAPKVLMSGTFVDVSLKGKILDNIFVIPRAALRNNSMVWIVDDESLLRTRTVQVVRYERENVLVKDGVHDGDKLVLTNLSGAAAGMKLRIEQTEHISENP